MRTNRAAIVMAQFGMPQLTLQCIQTLRRQHGDEPPVVLVDDGSAIGDVEQVLAAGLSNVELLRQPHRGVTAAWNAGANRCSAEILVFLNNDVVTTDSWVSTLCSLLDDERVAVAGVERRRERHAPAEVLATLPTTTFAAGWCFAVRRTDFEAVGGFRGALRLYFSDTDLQGRLLLRRGSGESDIAIASGLGVRHLGHATTSQCGSRKEQWQADRRRFTRLWRGPHAEPVQSASTTQHDGL
jgi:GT2 family glycosyltransferase